MRKTNREESGKSTEGHCRTSSMIYTNVHVLRGTRLRRQEKSNIDTTKAKKGKKEKKRRNIEIRKMINTKKFEGIRKQSSVIYTSRHVRNEKISKKQFR